MINLLADSGPMGKFVLSAACVLAAVAFLYGLLRKFSRMSWLSWQTALLFSATLPLSFLPATENGTLLFCLAAAGLLGVTALLFLIGAVLRKPFLALEQGGGAGRLFNRLLGGVTSLFNVVMLFAIVAGLALLFAQPYNLEFLNVVYSHPAWVNFASQHALDLAFVFLFAAVLRWGYHTGFLRMIVSITVIALTFLAVFLAMYMTLQVPFLAAFASQIAGTFDMNAIAAGWIGFGIVSFIVAFVLVLVVIFLAVLLNLLLRAAGKSHAFVVFDGILFSLITCAVLFVLVIVIDFGVSFVASGSLSQVAPEQMAGVAQAFTGAFQTAESVFTSSPLTNIFYTFNPLRLFIK